MRPPTVSVTAPRDLPLEGLRGLCADAVLYAHLFAPVAALDPRWAPPRQFWWLNLGYAAVLMFFVLSGYVIGLTTTRPWSPAEQGRYLSRRAFRLVPVVAVAVALSWLVAPATDARTVFGNLLFLQNEAPYPGGFTVPVLPNNPNLWSLNYEAVYYLGFLAVWRWAPAARTVWGVLVAGLLAAAALVPLAGFPPGVLLGRYACGALFWFAGLYVAWRTPPADPDSRRSEWPAALLCAYAIWFLAPLRTLCFELDLKSLMWPTTVSPHRLDFLPACLWVLLAVTGRAPALQRNLRWVCLGWATAGLAWYVASGSLVQQDYVAGVALVLAWLVHRWQPSAALLARLAPLGAVSFGLYAVALPIQSAQRGWFAAFSGSALTFSVRLALVVAASVALAWLVECRLQPWLRRRFASPGSINFPRESRPLANPSS